MLKFMDRLLLMILILGVFSIGFILKNREHHLVWNAEEFWNFEELKAFMDHELASQNGIVNLQILPVPGALNIPEKGVQPCILLYAQDGDAVPKNLLIYLHDHPLKEMFDDEKNVIRNTNPNGPPYKSR